MGRPATYTADSLLDAAVQLFAEHGPRAVTMTALADAVGAPSGSIYHRFPDRPSLLAAVWRRTARRFEDASAARIDPSEGAEAAITLASWSVQWCREHPAEAAVLLAGRAAFDPGSWSTADRQADAAGSAERDRRIARGVRAVAAASGRPADEVAFTMFQLPVAVVRQHLHAGRPLPASAVDLVDRLARAIMLS